MGSRLASGVWPDRGSAEGCPAPEQHQAAAVVHEILEVAPRIRRQRIGREVAEDHDGLVGQAARREIQRGRGPAAVVEVDEPPVRPTGEGDELQVAVGDDGLAQELVVERELILHVEHALAGFDHVDGKRVRAGLLVRRRVLDAHLELVHPDPFVGKLEADGPRLLVGVERGGGLADLLVAAPEFHRHGVAADAAGPRRRCGCRCASRRRRAADSPRPRWRCVPRGASA